MECDDDVLGRSSALSGELLPARLDMCAARLLLPACLYQLEVEVQQFLVHCMDLLSMLGPYLTRGLSWSSKQLARQGMCAVRWPLAEWLHQLEVEVQQALIHCIIPKPMLKLGLYLTRGPS